MFLFVVYLFLFETGPCCVVQAGLVPLGSSGLPASISLVADYSQEPLYPACLPCRVCMFNFGDTGLKSVTCCTMYARATVPTCLVPTEFIIYFAWASSLLLCMQYEHMCTLYCHYVYVIMSLPLVLPRMQYAVCVCMLYFLWMCTRCVCALCLSLLWM